MDLKPNYKTNDKDAKFDMVVFRIVHANMVMKLQNLIQYPPKHIMVQLMTCCKGYPPTSSYHHGIGSKAIAATPPPTDIKFPSLKNARVHPPPHTHTHNQWMHRHTTLNMILMSCGILFHYGNFLDDISYN